MKNRAKKIIAGSILILCLIVGGIIAAQLAQNEEQKSLATNTLPSPSAGADMQAQEDGFPVVDWDHWQEINPDIVGWITIPGTTIDSPIVQAHRENPNYYLKHDVYRNWNDWGAVYIDASCPDGLNSVNVVIYGHNMSRHENKMFGEIASYSSYDFAVSHQEIIVQSPEWKKRVLVAFSTITPGWEESNRTTFDDDADFASWIQARFEGSSMRVVETPEVPEQLFTLCTCSYTTYGNERTLVYAYR